MRLGLDWEAAKAITFGYNVFRVTILLSLAKAWELSYNVILTVDSPTKARFTMLKENLVKLFGSFLMDNMLIIAEIPHKTIEVEQFAWEDG